MHTDLSPQSGSAPGASRVLAVADWALDSDTIASALQGHGKPGAASLGVVVPASLHGIDWAGDPTASIPCAERQLQRLVHRVQAAGLSVDAARVGDPDPVAAALDALTDWSADEILLFPPRRRLLRAPSPLRLDRRIERATGLPVTGVVVSPTRARRGWLRSGGHCPPPRLQAA